MRMLVVALTLAALVGCSSFPSGERLEEDEDEGAAPVTMPSDGVHPPVTIGDEGHPFRAFLWRQRRWLDETGHIAPGAYEHALEQRQANANFWHNPNNDGPGGIDPLSWTSRGPENVGGRTRSLVIHPTDRNKLWAGSVGGGIWFSADGGQSWTPVNDGQENLAIGSLAFDPKNPDIMYAGTGEGYFNGDAIGGIGMFKSIDGGKTWALMESTKGWDNVCRIAISPADSNLILVGKRYGGILRSSDGGQHWDTMRWAQGSYDVLFDPNNPMNAVAQIIDYDWGVGDWFHAALYSTDAGLTWHETSGPLGKVWGFGSRIELAYARSVPGCVYASCAEGGGRIWRSLDGGQSYVLRTQIGTSGCNWYANPLWVDPVRPTTLVTGGYHTFRSTDGGYSLSQISDGYILTVPPHPDIQFITADPGFDGITNKRVYVCTDGGIFRTDDIYTASKYAGWTNLNNGYRTTQFYGADGHAPGGILYGGLQDNGTLRILDGSDNANLPFGGDGGYSAVDSGDPRYCYNEYIDLLIHRSTDGGQSAGYITDGLADAGVAANFIAPFILDQRNPSTLLAGGHSLWRTRNVKDPKPTWEIIREAGTDLISAIAVAPSDSNVIWMSQNNAEVYRTHNGTAEKPDWQTVDDNGATNPLPARWISRILIDRVDPETAFVCFGGFAPDNLQKTIDGGKTWKDITGSGPTGLPDAPIYGIAQHPGHRDWLYVATEIGVFATEDGGKHWSTSNDGPASVSTDEIVFEHGANTLLIATHGRGLFTATIKECRADLDHSTGYGVLDLFDYLAFQALFIQQDPAGDFDGDGQFTVFDFLAFQNAFAAGCP